MSFASCPPAGLLLQGPAVAEGPGEGVLPRGGRGDAGRQQDGPRGSARGHLRGGTGQGSLCPWGRREQPRNTRAHSQAHPASATHSHPHTHAHTPLHTLIHRYTLSHTHIYPHTLTHTHAHSPPHSHTLIRTHSHPLTHSHAHSHSHTYTHSHSPPHTHTTLQRPPPGLHLSPLPMETWPLRAARWGRELVRLRNTGCSEDGGTEGRLGVRGGDVWSLGVGTG